MHRVNCTDSGVRQVAKADSFIAETGQTFIPPLTISLTLKQPRWWGYLFLAGLLHCLIQHQQSLAMPAVSRLPLGASVCSACTNIVARPSWVSSSYNFLHRAAYHKPFPQISFLPTFPSHAIYALNDLTKLLAICHKLMYNSIYDHFISIQSTKLSTITSYAHWQIFSVFREV